MSTTNIKRHGKPSPVSLATVRIGKKGVTATLIQEISKNLEKRGRVKVRILKTGLGDRTAKEIAEEIADATRSTIIQLRGHTFTLRKFKDS